MKKNCDLDKLQFCGYKLNGVARLISKPLALLFETKNYHFFDHKII